MVVIYSWSDCYCAIALFGEFSTLIRILKGSFPVARFLFLPMSHAWFPHTENSLKSVEALLCGVGGREAGMQPLVFILFVI